jgi:DNA-binding CsgD family transcriptional regulator
MTEDLLGFAPSTDVIETLLSRSEGNPLFLTEMLRLLGDATRDLPGDVDLQTRLPVQMPDTVRDVIRVRLNRLSDKCNDILATAAVLGRDLDVEALAAASDGVSREDLLGAVDEALDAHVLEAVQQRPGHYRFTHILIRDTIEGELSQVKKARLHAYVGGALERIHADDVQRHAAKLAQHFSEAQPILGPAKAVRYSAMAGDSAMTSFAWEEAVVYFQRALMAGRDASVFDELEGQLSRADILARLGTARKAIAPRHQQQEAVDNLSEAFDQYVAMGDRSKALTVALGPFPQIPVVTGVEKILLRALEIAPRESPEAGRLLSQLVAVHGLQEPDMERGQQALQQGLIIARKSRDKSLEMSLLANAAQWLDVANLRFSSGTEKAQEALSLAPATDDLHLQVLARSAAICCLMCGMGDLKEALSHAARLLPLADRLHERHWQAIAHAHYSAVSSLLGDWYTARHHSDLALALEPLSAQILGPRVILEYEKGNVSEAEAKLSALLEAMRLVQPGANNETSIPSIVLPLVTRITGEVSHVASAEAAARAVLASPRSIPLHTLAARAGLGLIAAQRNDTSSAQEQYEAISEFQGTMVTWVSCSNDRVLGILASAIGRPDRAASHFEDALERTRAAGYAPEMARTCYDYASFLVQSDPLPRDPNYRQKISGLVGEGLAVASRLDMPALKADLASLRLNRFGRDAVAYPADLTPRETEVLCLVAAGLSNREIAQKLVITYNTAVNHVKSILNKTGCTNRAGLAAFAVRNGLDRTIVD